MFISLPAHREPSHRQSRRSPLTPPSVTPPSLSGSSTMQCERDRCKSPSSRATALLAKVAIVAASPQPMASTPSAPRMAVSISNQSSTSTSPLSTPPGEGGHFPFGMSSKELPESPDGGYISFPVFEEFGEYKSEDERDGGSLPPRKR